MEGLTDGGLGGGGHLHTSAIVRYVVIRAGAHWPAGTEQTQPFTLLPITWVSHCKKKKYIRQWEKTPNICNHAFVMHPKYTFTQTLTLRLFVAVIEGYVSGVVDASGQILRLAYTKLVNPEDNVIGVGNPINVILKDINAEGVEEICKKEREAE